MKNFFYRHNDQKGIGLIAVLFTIVILASFGTVIARYTQTTSVASAEDYVWAKSYYAVESGIRLRILQDDGGGNWAGWSYPLINGFTITEISSTLQPVGQPSTIVAQAQQGSLDIIRRLEVRYIK